MRLLLTFFAVVVFLGALGFASVMGLYAYYARDLPDPGALSSRQLFQTANIFDRKARAFLQIAGADRIVIDTGLNLPSMLWASQWEPERATLAYRHLDTVLEVGLIRADGVIPFDRLLELRPKLRHCEVHAQALDPVVVEDLSSRLSVVEGREFLVPR